jgi:hypothetical protein
LTEKNQTIKNKMKKIQKKLTKNNYSKLLFPLEWNIYKQLTNFGKNEKDYIFEVIKKPLFWDNREKKLKEKIKNYQIIDPNFGNEEFKNNISEVFKIVRPILLAKRHLEIPELLTKNCLDHIINFRQTYEGGISPLQLKLLKEPEIESLDYFKKDDTLHTHLRIKVFYFFKKISIVLKKKFFGNWTIVKLNIFKQFFGIFIKTIKIG